MYQNPFVLAHFGSFLRALSQHRCNMGSCTIPSWILEVTCPFCFELMLIEVSNQRSDLLVIPKCLWGWLGWCRHNNSCVDMLAVVREVCSALKQKSITRAECNWDVAALEDNC
jgi:hypothetical protein